MALATDFYQLTMMYAYFASPALAETEATYEMFVRRLPKNRRFLVAAGLEQGLAYLRDLRFTGEDIDYLRTTPTFAALAATAQRDAFFERLRAFRFGATVRSVPEGTIFFPNEPILQVSGSMIEGQLVETFLLTMINYQTLVASKAARIRLVSGERDLIDFGSRRAHGPEAAALAARAAYVGGFNGTSNVMAAMQLGIPVVGTAAHAFTMAFGRETEAFAHYHATFPDSTVLLIDTYDTLRGARRAAAIGEGLKGVRLDSGDLTQLAHEVRAILDEAGLQQTRIVASSDLNEYKIAEMLAAGAPIDTFGVGTELVTSKDDPALAGVYKLVEKIEGGRAVPTMKFSSSKNTYPGRKELYRITGADGKILAGLLTQAGEPLPTLAAGERAEPLLQRMFDAGGPTAPPEPIDDLRARTRAQLLTLPDHLLGMEGDVELPELRVSARTLELMDVCESRFEVS